MKPALVFSLKQRDPSGSLPIGQAPFFLSVSSHLADWITGAAFVALYVALEHVSFIHQYKGIPITPWNPGLGAVFALMLFGGARYTMVLFIGAIIAEIVVLQSSLAWAFDILISAIIAISYGAVAYLARSKLRLDSGLNHVRDVLILLGGGASGAILVAVLLSLLLLLQPQHIRADVIVAVGPLLVGDLIGIAVMTPLMLRLVFRAPRLPFRRLRTIFFDLLLYLAFASIALWIIVGAQTANGSRLFYMLFLPVVIAALRYGLDGACVGLAITQFGLVGLLHFHGYDVQAFTEFQALMFVLTVTGLIVGVVVSERESADRLAREARARLKEREAEAAQAARFSLVSGMASALAHEINQPMTAARALARSAQHILQTPGADLARAEKNLANMIAQIDHANGVLRRVREFLRRGRPHFSTIDIASMLNDALALAQTEASAKQVQIELDIAEDLPPIHGDVVQLEQVVLNLVRNAIEAITGASRSDGRVRIVASRHDAPPRIEFAILDNGPGIASELADRLFEHLTTSKREGLGLGLPICASIVESHGGRIWLHSGKAGATEFRFLLPLESA
jgi:two-component system sensor kinase FixL